jgi:quercetin dioxygenase-like cupin family protein
MNRIIIHASIGSIVICLFLGFLTLAPLNAENTTEQIISHIDQILKENPLPADKKAQMIKIAEDDTATLYVLRAIDGAEVKPHIHKTHDEIVYVVKGMAQMFINGKWVDLKPGSLHFNPMGKVHGLKYMGTEPLVGLSIFTPAMRETDRYFVK